MANGIPEEHDIVLSPGAQWYIDQVATHLKRDLHNLDDRIQLQFKSSEIALEKAAANNETRWTYLDGRLLGINEWRDTINDLSRLLVTKEVLDALLAKQDAKYDAFVKQQEIELRSIVREVLAAIISLGLVVVGSFLLHMWGFGNA